MKREKEIMKERRAAQVAGKKQTKRERVSERERERNFVVN
jgi:hypothetical protein